MSLSHSSGNDRDLPWALTAPDAEVGPACMHVPVPPTIAGQAGDHAFEEAYNQGYRHALADVRKWLQERG